MAISAPWGLCGLPGWLQRVVGTRFPLCPNTKWSRRKGLRLRLWWLRPGIPHQERGGPAGLGEEKGASGLSLSLRWVFSLFHSYGSEAGNTRLGGRGVDAMAYIYLSLAERYQQRTSPGSVSPSVRGELGQDDCPGIL